MQNNNTEPINTELTQIAEDKAYKKNLLYLILLFFIFFSASVFINVYFYYQNVKHIENNGVLKQSILELETKSKGADSINANINDSEEWSIISENSQMKSESGFVKIKAQKTTDISRNSVKIKTGAFVKDKGEFYVTYDEQNDDIITGSLWFKNLYSEEEKLIDFIPHQQVIIDEFGVQVITHPRRTDIAIIDIGFQYYLVNFNNIKTSIKKIELTQVEYKHWEEIVGWYESNIVVAEKTNETSGADFDIDAEVVKFWMAPISDLSKKTYLDE
ncbi:MAG: hypothetical protein GW762_03360 [Candidatus Pacebacteria bacterium]|nr:hypothetical protein [Candidatus Paceibacterota bacterium]PIR64282.1 MAG: hypothetical protein COU64_00130 [Candidatus Pacebacteria bacterium CG10_big_fil_rev_8_21_14_0_10_40_26]PIZ78670.1 MAG: hypothetical protein COY01_03500 [Candidatus Pacebacteria bacterium CG_4_10_14_0_2_um_filter_40_20]PJA68478.1 MAG: hypothetical protein CO156_05815 [Candidatus Pacebacteria bacterium CG_4_9_14_3_um_filter_40_12]PJC41340.1 MAG: hypothetical protein CO041_05885 [Candidatus Pacebacteria bacterium CG_4_9_